MRFLTHLVVSVLCAAALLAAPSTSSAGSPPPPPWRPTNTLKIYFVLNNDLRRAGELCQPRQPCSTGPQLVQRKIDYLNSVFEANKVNLKAESAGIRELAGNTMAPPSIRRTACCSCGVRPARTCYSS